MTRAEARALLDAARAGRHRVWTLDTVRDRCTLDGDCWMWAQGVNGKGAPQASIGGKSTLVRRWVVAQRLRRPLPAGARVRAICGHSLCCAPEHLVLSNAGEILALAYAGGKRNMARHAALMRGPSRTWGKLTMEDARTIRRERHLGAEALALRYSVHPDTIRRIFRGELWREHLPAASVFAWAEAA